MNSFKVDKKCTVAVTMPNVPKRIEVYNSKLGLYYFRDLADYQHNIKFNIATPGDYTINTECSNIEILPLKIHPIKVELPPIEKNFYHSNFIFRYNPELKGTPARNFYKKGIIEYGDNFLKQPYPIRVFILSHEIGHSFYHDEKFADLYGAKLYVDNGYNNSTALHSLTDVLKSPGVQNFSRIEHLYNALKR